MLPTTSSRKTPTAWRGTGNPSSAMTVGAMSTFSTVYAPSRRHSSHVFLWSLPEDSPMMSHTSLGTTAGVSAYSSSRRARATKRAPSTCGLEPAWRRAVRARVPRPESRR